MALFKNYTIGSDPELFIINTQTNKVVSSIGLIPGEKGNPYRTDDMPKGFGLEIDNILAEFNIPAVNTKKDWIAAMNYMKNYIRNYVKKVNPNFDILCAASMNVPKNQLNTPEAQLFGCDPDYNAYTQAVNPKPQGERGTLRSAGCHIHIGYPRFNAETSIELVKYLDVYLGLPSVVIDPDTKRRSLYGKAGSFRLQPWGVEYRVLSSAMMKDDETLALVWDQIEKAIVAHHYRIELPPADLVQQAINESNVVLAKELINKFQLM